MRNMTSLKKRAGFAWAALIGFIVVIAAMAAYVVPTLGSAKLPAVESNLKEDIQTLKKASEQYYAMKGGSFAGLSMGELVKSGVLKGATAERIYQADNTLFETTDTSAITDYYKPSYTDTAIKISIAPAGTDGVNLFIDASATSFAKDLENNMIKFFGESIAPKFVGGATTAISTTGITAATADTAGSEDGKLMVTYP